MFLDFYKMREQPFGVTPDPRFLYLGKSHREALASIYYGIETDRGFAALIAKPGLGKTTITFQLLEKFQRTSRTLFLFQTQCSSRELFQYLLNDLGVNAAGMDMVSMHNKLKEILSRELLAGRRFILAIDEAQNLAPEVLETIRMLSNFETSRAKLLQILLIGQPQLAQKLASPALEQLQQRISVFARIEPFGFEDTVCYIAHRLQVAGYNGVQLFTPAALLVIAEQSQGVPRKINGLCFSALSLAYAMGRTQVDADIMAEVIADLDVDVLHGPPVSQPVVPSPAAKSPVLTYYYAQPKTRFDRWALGIATVAASIVVAAGGLLYSPNRVERALQATNNAWISVRNAAGLRSHPQVKSDIDPVHTALDDQVQEIPNDGSGQFSPSGDAQINSVVVQPGDTLRQIVLRTLGEYNFRAIEQIRKLNPSITDLDDLKAGQEIRFQRASAPVAESESVNADGRN